MSHTLKKKKKNKSSIPNYTLKSEEMRETWFLHLHKFLGEFSLQDWVQWWNTEVYHYRTEAVCMCLSFHSLKSYHLDGWTTRILSKTETGAYLQRQQVFQSPHIICSYFTYTSKIWGTLLAQPHRGFMTINTVETDDIWQWNYSD